MKTALPFYRTFYLQALAGGFFWLLLLIIQPPNLYHDQWARLLLQLAVLVLVPLVLQAWRYPDPRMRYALFPAAVGVVVSLQLEAGPIAAIWALPWLLVTSGLFVSGTRELLESRRVTAPVAAKVFILIGGLSLIADRLGLQPLGFDPAIVLLTAVHFHFAGFVYLFLLGRAVEYWPGTLSKRAAALAVLAVPLTAVGITTKQVWQEDLPETLAAITVVASGFLGALVYLRQALRGQHPTAVRICWIVLALSLLLSMTMSLGYALRPYYRADVLTIPVMRALHGTANAFGVALTGVLGWFFADRKATVTRQ
ncbi:MAG: hypothetical protein EP344_10600 [Bacteroidetes bacterium]|nr:MAG: hypothetical protein EP344_10600 [Bacteroidota bacterium]